MSSAGVDLGAEAYIPAGLHPQDQSWPPNDYNPGAEQSAPSSSPRGTAPFSTPNGRAIPVFQRAAEQGAEQSFTLTQPAMGGYARVTLGGRIVGRVALTVWVPGWATYGVQWSFNAATVDNGQGLLMFPGEGQTFLCEAPVYAGLQPGQTTGLVYVSDLWNPAVMTPGT